MKYLFLLFIAVGAFAQAPEPAVRDSLTGIVSQAFADVGKCRVSYRKASIPRSVRKHLSRKLDGFAIANPGKNFRAGCVAANPLLPNKQLQFTITSGPYFGMVFKNGGKALSTYFVFAKRIKGETRVLGIYDIGGNGLNEYLDELRAENIRKSWLWDE